MEKYLTKRDRCDRILSTEKNAPVAQRIEYSATNRLVRGSNPPRRAKNPS